jgi:hypothetical protein
MDPEWIHTSRSNISTSKVSVSQIERSGGKSKSQIPFVQDDHVKYAKLPKIHHALKSTPNSCSLRSKMFQQVDARGKPQTTPTFLFHILILTAHGTSLLLFKYKYIAQPPQRQPQPQQPNPAPHPLYDLPGLYLCTWNDDEMARRRMS